MTLGVLDEGEIDAAIAVPVQVQGRLRPSSSQRCLLSRVGAIRAEVAEPRFLGPVIADRRREVALAAKALLDVAEIFVSSASGGTASVTTRRQWSGANAAAPYAVSAPQSLPIRTARSSPPRASCSPTASATSAPSWKQPSAGMPVGAYPRMNGATA